MKTTLSRAASLFLAVGVALGVLGGTAVPAAATSSDTATAFEANTNYLFQVTPSGASDLQLGMMAGTSPSIAKLADGSYVMAFQANTGYLYTAGAQGTRNWGLGMKTGTSPSIAAVGAGGFQVAFQANTGYLWVVGQGGGASSPGDLQLGMMAGTSPSITGLSGGGYQAAFQANTGYLYTAGAQGTRNWGLGMKTGTSPSIAAVGAGGFQVAFQANTGYLWTVGSGAGAVNDGDRRLGLNTKSSPAIAGPSAAFGGQVQAYKAWALNPANWNSYTPKEYRGIDSDGWYGAQCADLGIAWSKWVGRPASFDGWDDSRAIKAGWHYVAGNMGSALPGDVITSVGGIKHVVVVVGAPSGGVVPVIQQNPASPAVANYSTGTNGVIWRLN